MTVVAPAVVEVPASPRSGGAPPWQAGPPLPSRHVWGCAAGEGHTGVLRGEGPWQVDSPVSQVKVILAMTVVVPVVEVPASQLSCGAPPRREGPPLPSWAWRLLVVQARDLLQVDSPVSQSCERHLCECSGALPLVPSAPQEEASTTSRMANAAVLAMTVVHVHLSTVPRSRGDLPCPALSSLHCTRQLYPSDSSAKLCLSPTRTVPRPSSTTAVVAASVSRFLVSAWADKQPTSHHIRSRTAENTAGFRLAIGRVKVALWDPNIFC